MYAYCFLNETESGKKAREIVKHGDVQALSFYAIHTDFKLDTSMLQAFGRNSAPVFRQGNDDAGGACFKESTHKYFVSADEASREEYLECNVQPRDITTTGFITFKNDTDPSEDITVNVIRFELSANGTT